MSSRNLRKLKLINYSQNIYFFLFSIILILAIFFRFFRVGDTFSIFFDVARDLEAVSKIIKEKDLTLLGPHVSLGLWSERELYFGPLHYYLVLFPLLVAKMNPLGPVVFTGITNLFSGIIFFLILSQIIKQRWISLWAFTFYVLSPISIDYSRFFWNPNFLPFFTALVSLFFWLFLKQRKNIFIFLTGLFTGFCFQLHYITLPLFMATLFALILINQRERIRLTTALTEVFLLLGGFLVGIFPILLFEIRHKFFLTDSLLFHLSSGEKDFSFSFSLWWSYFRSMVGRSLGLVDYSLHSPGPFSLLDQFFSIFFIILVSATLVSGWYSKRKDLPFYYFCWALTIILIGLPFSVLWTFNGVVEDRYFLYLLIFLFITITVSEDFIFQKFFLDAGKISFFLRVLIIFLGFFIIFLSTRKNFNIVTKEIGIDEYNMNFKGVKIISSIISNDVKNNHFQGKFNIANIVDGNTRATYYRYFLDLEGTPPLSVDQYSQAEILYVLSKKDGQHIINYPVWEIESFGDKKITGYWEGPLGVKIYRLEKTGEK